MLSFPKAVFKNLIFVLCLQLCCVAGPAGAADGPQIGIVQVSNLNLRPTPGVNKPPIKKLQKNTRVRILGHHDKWLKVSHEGQTGYIANRERFVRIVRPQTAAAPTETTQAANLEAIQKEAETLNQQIEKSKVEVLEYNRRETAVLSRLNALDRKLHQSRRKIARSKTELAGLEKRIGKNLASFKGLEKEIASGETYTSQRLTAIYKMRWLGQMNLLASAESMHELLQMQKMLAQIIASDQKELEALKGKKNRLQNLIQTLHQQQNDKRDIEKALIAQSGNVSRDMAARQSLLDDIRNKRSVELAALEALKASALALDQKISALNQQRFAHEATGMPQPKVAFASLKGLLNLPVKGKITKHFGAFKNAKFNVVNFRSGIQIRAERGEPIRAVHSGKILYANWFKGYGNMIILDHGQHYYTVYAHLEELFKNQGDPVEAGEVIATVGDTGSMHGAGLHFEVRHHGKPLDPLRWIKKG